MLIKKQETKKNKNIKPDYLLIKTTNSNRLFTNVDAPSGDDLDLTLFFGPDCTAQTILFKYDYKGREIEKILLEDGSNKVLKYKTYYNNDGSIAWQSFNNLYDSIELKKIYKYYPDKKLKLIEVSDVENLVLEKEKLKYETRDLKKLISHSKKALNEELNFNIKYEYDKNGMLKKKFQHYEDNSLKSIIKYVYNRDKTVKQQKLINELNNKIIKCNLKYDDNKRLIETIETDNNDRVLSVTKYFYDKAGKDIGYELYNPFNKLVEKKEAVYDERGLNIALITCKYNDEGDIYYVVEQQNTYISFNEYISDDLLNKELSFNSSAKTFKIPGKKHSIDF